MAVHVRLQRKGSTHRPFYHLVAADHRSPRDGRFIEKIGYYNPATEPSTLEIKADRLAHWYLQGAQLSKAAANLAKIKGISLKRAGSTAESTKADATSTK